MPSRQVTINQDNFSLGMFPGFDPFSVFPGGCLDIENGLLGDDGVIMSRGGIANVTSTNFGTDGLRFIWAGWFAAGHRTLVASDTAFGVVDVAGTGVVSLGGGGMLSPRLAASFEGKLFIPSPGGVRVYAGSRKSGSYGAGTVSTGLGGPGVSGTGTSWLANVDPGMIFRLTDHAHRKAYVVKSVESDTSLTLTEPFGEAVIDQDYLLDPLYTTIDEDPYPFPATEAVCSIANKLLWVDPDEPDVIRFTDVDFDSVLGFFLGVGGEATNFHRVPDGRRVRALVPFRDFVLIFTDRDVWKLEGIAFNIVSPDGTPQHRLTRLYGDEVVLWGQGGVAFDEDRIVVAAQDGVFRIDGVSQPERLSRSIDAMYRSAIRGGVGEFGWTTPGGSAPSSMAEIAGGAEIYRNHYILPLMGSARVQTTLVCRLDRPRESPIGAVFPWSRLTGKGANVTAFTASTAATGEEELIGASAISGADTGPPAEADRNRIVNASGFFDSTANNGQDTGTNYTFTVIPALIPTTEEKAKSVVRWVRLFYELDDAAGVNPELDLAITEDYASYTALGSLPENATGTASPRVKVGIPSRRYMALRVVCPDQTDKLILRGIEYRVRPSRNGRA